MGWASGSQLAEDVWEAVRPHLSEDVRRMVAIEIVGLFEGYDCDTLCEAQTLVVDSGLPEYMESE
jgi:hypothetical protein